MVILDVREKEEFEAEHIPGSIFCPLSQFNLMAPGILKSIPDHEIVIMCRSGKRAQMALTEIQKLDVPQHKLTVYSGGILKWKSEGRPVTGATKSIPLMRQVQLAASALILTGLGLSWFVHPNFIYLVLFVGLGLGVAGLTGFCGMARLLQLMPWNAKE